jgi:hypothetical protein
MALELGRIEFPRIDIVLQTLSNGFFNGRHEISPICNRRRSPKPRQVRDDANATFAEPTSTYEGEFSKKTSRSTSPAIPAAL